jgi:hypothetical protein
MLTKIYQHSQREQTFTSRQCQQSLVSILRSAHTRGSHFQPQLTQTRTDTDTDTDTYAHTHTHTNMHTYAHANIHAHALVHIHTSAHSLTHKHVHTRPPTHTHSPTHRQAHSQTAEQDKLSVLIVWIGPSLITSATVTPICAIPASFFRSGGSRSPFEFGPVLHILRASLASL